MAHTNKDQAIRNRDKYFRISILLGFTAPGTILKTDLPTLMSATGFIPQTRIERILDKLQIPDRGRLIELEKFHGQLQKDKGTGLPYWNIFLITQNLTTRKRLLDALLEKLKLTPDKTSKTALSTVQVKTISSFHELKEEERLSFPNTVWYPGFFSDQTVLFDKLLTNNEVEEVIKSYPEKYKEILKDVLELDGLEHDILEHDISE